MTFWSNVKLNGGFTGDPDWRRCVAKWAAVSLLLISVAAWFSYGFYHLDEYYQILEFTSFKLGKTPAAELAWEYHRQSRPWMQPAIYFGIAKAAMLVGIESPFKLALLFRAFDGLCCWGAVVSLMLVANVFFRERQQRRAAVMVLALMWLIPYLAVRTSCESLSCDFLSLGLAALVFGSLAEGERRRFPWPTLLISGFCLGLAFEFRYQTAFAAAGIMGWVLFVASENRRRGLVNCAALCGGIAAAVALGTLVDCWGYGQWAFAPWNYFRTQLLEGMAARSGTMPVTAYLRLMNGSALAPLSLAITAAMFITWVRHPRHIITWATLPFFVAHSLVGHKEVRYLFPMTLIGTFFLVLAVMPRDGRQPAILRWIWERRGSWGAKILYAMNFVALALVCFKVSPSSVVIQKYIYDHYPEGCQLYVLGEKSPYENVTYNMFFYRPKNLTITQLADRGELDALLQTRPSHFLLVTDRQSTPVGQDSLVPQAETVYRTYPQWLEAYNYFNWQRRSEFFRLAKVNVEVSGNALAAGQTALRQDRSTQR